MCCGSELIHIFLLKIEVTHGLDLKVPVVGRLLTKALLTIDPQNAPFYERNKLPLTSVAIVRMQSEAWEDEIVAAGLAPEAGNSTTESEDGQGQITVVNADDGSNDTESDDNCHGGSHGLGSSPVLIDASSYESGICSVADTGFSTPGVESGDEVADAESPVGSEECEA